MKRFALELPGYEVAEVQKVGTVVRFELHSDAATIILDFTRDDARSLADALHAACHRDLWREPGAVRRARRPGEDVKDPDALQAAITRHAQARAAVDEWMHAEADSLRLRRNSEAPGWIEYQHALADLWVEIRRREPAQSNPEGT